MRHVLLWVCPPLSEVSRSILVWHSSSNRKCDSLLCVGIPLPVQCLWQETPLDKWIYDPTTTFFRHALWFTRSLRVLPVYLWGGYFLSVSCFFRLSHSMFSKEMWTDEEPWISRMRSCTHPPLWSSIIVQCFPPLSFWYVIKSHREITFEVETSNSSEVKVICQWN